MSTAPLLLLVYLVPAVLLLAATTAVAAAVAWTLLRPSADEPPGFGATRRAESVATVAGATAGLLTLAPLLVTGLLGVSQVLPPAPLLAAAVSLLASGLTRRVLHRRAARVRTATLDRGVPDRGWLRPVLATATAALVLLAVASWSARDSRVLLQTDRGTSVLAPEPVRALRVGQLELPVWTPGWATTTAVLAVLVVLLTLHSAAARARDTHRPTLAPSAVPLVRARAVDGVLRTGTAAVLLSLGTALVVASLPGVAPAGEGVGGAGPTWWGVLAVGALTVLGGSGVLLARPSAVPLLADAAGPGATPGRGVGPG